MVCIYCNSPTKVTNSRLQKKSNHIWRRRSCDSCKAVFTTVESVISQQSIVVEDGSAKIEPFSRDKLFISVYDSCRHRKNAVSDAGHLTDTIMNKIFVSIKGGAIQKGSIEKFVAATLKRFDKVAMVNYQAYYVDKKQP
jgi:transcriptional regulator NrdR family protein